MIAIYREALAEKEVVIINGKKYTIRGLIGRGGCSLVYLADEENNNSHPWILKEFFPNGQIAKREKERRDNSYRKVTWCEGQKSRFENMRHRFIYQENRLGNILSEITFQIYAFDCVDEKNGFAVMKPFSKDTKSVLEIVKEWEANGASLKSDVQFLDLERIKKALCMTEVLLLLLKKIHNKQILHLDLSFNNVLGAGWDKASEAINGSVFILDFGCAVKMDGEKYLKKIPNYYSYSPGFAAPEILDSKVDSLDFRTDIYSVGALLYYLCVGSHALKPIGSSWRYELYNERKRKNIINFLAKLHIPSMIKGELINIIMKSCSANPEKRFQTAEEMRIAIEQVRKKCDLAEYEKPHLDLSEVKPITESYVRHSEKVMKQIDRVLYEHGVCYIHGMSGTGKSELIRQYVEEYCQNIPSLEIYFPEQGKEYKIEQVISGLSYVNLREKNSLEEKKEVFCSFLEKEVVLLLHNFNSPELTFIQELKRKNVKILVSTQCTKEQLERKNVPEESLIELKPDEEFCVRIFKKVYENYKKSIPAQEKELYILSRLVFNIPILVHIVAMQLVDMGEKEFQWLIKELKDVRIDTAFEDTPEVEYQKDKTIKVEGTPFDVVCHIIQKILPPLTGMEKQCLQVMTKIPSQWVSVIEITQILGDFPDNMRCKKANTAIKRLINKHMLQEKQVAGKQYVSIHALLAIVMHTKKNDVIYLEDPKAEFWQHIERNKCVSSVREEIYQGGREKMDDESLFFLFYGLKEQYGNTGFYLNTSKQIIDIWYDKEYWKKKINNLHEMTFVGRFSYRFLCKDGIEVYESRVLSEPLLVLEAGEQLKPVNRYFDDSMSKSNQRGERTECYLGMYITGVANYQEFKMPTDIQGVPITGCDLDIHGDSIKVLNSSCEEVTFEEIILPKQYRYFSGRQYGNIGFIKKVVLNSGLEYFGGFHSNWFDRWDYLLYQKNNIEEIVISDTVKNIEENAFDKYINKVIVNPENQYFVEEDGVIYTSDYKRLLFVPPEKRNHDFKVSSCTKYIDFSCWGIELEDISLKLMPYDDLEKVNKNLEKFTELQWGLFLSANNCKDKSEFVENLENRSRVAYNKEIFKNNLLKINLERREKIISMYKGGRSVEEIKSIIKKDFNYIISINEINSIVKEFEEEGKLEKLMSFVRERDNKIISMHENGMTSEEIATQIGAIYDIEMPAVNSIIEKAKIRKILAYKS